jgi:hypothetical protein
MQRDQQKWCVAASDQEKDGRMIEFPQDLFGPQILKAVIEGRGGVQEHQGGAKYGRAHHMPDGAVKGRKKDEQYQPQQAEDNTDPMGDTMGEFFTGGVGSGHD